MKYLICKKMEGKEYTIGCGMKYHIVEAASL